MKREPTNYLRVNDTSKQWVADRLTTPAFPRFLMWQ